MSALTIADRIWNRACEGGGVAPLAGDRALAALIAFHSTAMNGGVLHAIERLDDKELAETLNGYRFFSLESVAQLIKKTRSSLENGGDPEELEISSDGEYSAHVPDDSALIERFHTYLQAHNSDFAPLP